MMKLTNPITRFASVLAVIAAVSVLPALSQTGTRQIIDEMITALGGEAYLSVQEIHTTGRFFTFRRGELTNPGEAFVDYIKFPDAERTEFGRDRNRSITINVGSEGWTIEDRGNRIEPQPAAQAEEFLANFKTSFDYVLRYAVNHPETTVQNLGTEIIDFKRADIVELRDPDKNLIRFSIDRDTRFPVKMQVRRVDQREVREERFANWHSFQGVMTPMFLIRYADGEKTMEIRLDSAAYNTGLPESLFTPVPSR